MEQSKLKEILDQHRLWIESNGVQGQRATLGGAKLTRAYLKGADLCGANLDRANLCGANLCGANLCGANLCGANLNGAFFYRANLNRADLSGGDLSGADFGGANLLDANLTGANLCVANLSGANLWGANLWGANLWGANLKDATGLPNVSWIIPGCLVQLNQIKYDFYLQKEDKWESFVQDSFGLFIQDNPEESTFDMLVGDRIIRGIPDWVKYTGMKKLDP